MATTVISGTDRHISATLRHNVNVPSRYTTKNPSMAATPAHAIRMPRMDGCVISPTYVMIGASMKPTPRPSSTAATNTSSLDCAKYSIVHAMMCGMLTSIIALRRPIGSEIQPDRALPIGWLMYATLPYQVACSAVKCSVSSGLRSVCRPRSTGMTMVGKATARPRSTSSRFLAELARICGGGGVEKKVRH